MRHNKLTKPLNPVSIFSGEDQSGDLQISFDECVEIESQMGQLIYAHIDNGPKQTDKNIDPAYINMVADLGIGGVLPQLGTGSEITKISVKKLHQVSQLPLLIGADSL